jgi:hypothetical protein
MFPWFIANMLTGVLLFYYNIFVEILDWILDFMNT